MREGYSFVTFYGKAYPIDYADALVSIYRKTKTQK
jgi:hypothetical protein